MTTNVDPRVNLTFVSKGNASTKWLEVEYPVDAKPVAMLEALASVGFIADERFAMGTRKAYGYDENQRYVDLGYRIQDVHLMKSGAGLFGAWTTEEARVNMREARRILRQFGFTRVPIWKKTLVDMM